MPRVHWFHHLAGHLVAALGGLASVACPASEGTTAGTALDSNTGASTGLTDSSSTMVESLTDPTTDDTGTGTTSGDSTATTTTGDACHLADDNVECGASAAPRAVARALPPTPVRVHQAPFAAPSVPTAAEVCDIFAQDCPEGQKCNPYANDGGQAWNAVGCFPLDPNPGKPGDPCFGNGTMGPDTCEEGAFCMYDGAAGGFFCERLCGCSLETTTCGENEKCKLFNQGVLPLCLPLCDPLAEQPCPDGDVCVKSGWEADFYCVSDASGAKGGLRDPCQAPNDCDPGFSCEYADHVPGGCDFGADTCCTPLCDLSDPVCPEGSYCLEYFGGFGLDTPVCLQNVGYCEPL